MIALKERKSPELFRLSLPTSYRCALVFCWALWIHLAAASQAAPFEPSRSTATTPAPPITALRFDENHKQWIAARGSNIVVYDESAQHIERTISTSFRKISDIQFVPNYDQILVAGGNPGEFGQVSLLSWPTGEIIKTRQLDTDVITQVCTQNESNKIFCAGHSGSLTALSLDSLESAWTIDAHPGGCTSLKVIPSRELIATGGNDATIRIWKVSDGTLVRTLSQHTAAITQLLTNLKPGSDTSELISLGQDKTVRLWDAQTGRMIRFVKLPSNPKEAGWEPYQNTDTSMQWVLGDDGRLRRINMQQGVIEQDIGGSSDHTFALGYHANHLFIAGQSAEIKRISARAPLPRIIVAPDTKRFTEENSSREFRVRGFNYDHDAEGRLIEDYWIEQWPTIEQDFTEMQDLGINTVRIHLQFGRFMNSATEPNQQNLAKFSELVRLAERTRLYLDVTGLGCYHKQDVPAWYDELNEQERWNAQAEFWRAIIKSSQNSPAIFCWDLMNEPVVPGGKRPPRDWLGPPLGDKHFVQFITLDQNKRPRAEIAKVWIQHLCKAIRESGNQSMITVGMVDWSLDRPGLTSGFIPSQVADPLDFIAVHIYPQSGKLEEAATTLEGFNLGKPVVIEECFPLQCTQEELRRFLKDNESKMNGWISFYWGETPGELATKKTIAAEITRQWLLNLPQ